MPSPARPASSAWSWIETTAKGQGPRQRLGDLKDVTMGVVKAIGGELAGSIRTGVEWITRIGVAVKNWIKDHRGLATVIFGSATAVTALGFALTVAGVGMRLPPGHRRRQGGGMAYERRYDRA